MVYITEKKESQDSQDKKQRVLNNPKILIGCPVHSSKSYCLDDYFNNLQNINYHNKEFYFVDNSDDMNWHVHNIILKWGFDCDHAPPKGKRNNEILCECQNKIRDKVLNEDFDYLFFSEADTFPPSDILFSLLAYNSPLSVARYFIGTDDATHMIGTEIEQSFGKSTNRNMPMQETFMEYGRKKTKSGMFGFACCLIHRDILQQTKFFTNPDSPDHSDTNFWFQMRDMGVVPAIHDEIIEHRNKNWNEVSNYLQPA